MNKHYGLLQKIADEYSISKGAKESDNEYKARLIYSYLGIMGYASLWDTPEDGTSVSITHFKTRIENILSSLVDLYPEISSLFPSDQTVISNEIYDVFLKSGVIYHEPNRIVPARKIVSNSDGISFTRGYPADIKQNISGLGTYQNKQQNDNALSPYEMFQIDNNNVANVWNRTIESANFHHIQLGQRIEFLRIKGPFNHGYWVDKPNRTGNVSLIRTAVPENRTYFLYKYEGDEFLVSQLPNWMVSGYNYRLLSNACLMAYHELPKIKYSVNGDIVMISQEYLLPPAELNLIKLYSWPISYMALPRDFSRIMTIKVFKSIKELLVNRGYSFIEEK